MLTKLPPAARSLGALSAAVALVLAVGPGVAGAGGPGAAAGPPPAAGVTTDAAPAITVTLVSGDRVTLTADGAHAQVALGAGRAGLRFASDRYNGHQFVVPEDARPLVAAGTLDRRLFDVAGLAAAGHRDGTGHGLPLIIEAGPGAAALSAPGVRVTQRLDALGLVTAELDPAAAGLAWSQLRPGHGVSRLWLDGTRTVAPGHTVAGTACAAGGACAESAVLAAMARAAARGERALDVGVAPAGTRNDPLRAAADRLTADAGTQVTFAADASQAQAGTQTTHRLTVRHIDSNGNLTGSAESMVYGMDSGIQDYLSSADGTASMDLPEGHYVLVGDVVEFSGGTPQWHRVVQPELDLTQDTTVTIDARTTRPVGVTVPRPEARIALIDLGFQRWYGNGLSFASSVGASSFDGLFTGHLGPELPADQMIGYVASTWGVPGATGDFLNTPFTYNLMDTLHGRFYTGYQRTVDDGQLATLNVVHNQQVPGRRGSKALFGGAPGVDGSLYVIIPYDLPSRVTHHLEGGEALWSSAFGEHVVDSNGLVREVTALGQGYVQYVAGQEYSTRWNAAVFGPHFDYAEHSGRDGDFLWFGVPMHTDQEGHRGGSMSDSAWTKVWRNGQLVVEGGSGQVTATVPAQAGRFVAHKHVERPSYSDISTMTDAEWTFTSSTTAGRLSLPLWTVRFFPNVDDNNYVAYSPVTELRVQGHAQLGGIVGDIAMLTVEISADQGTTWRKTRLVRTGTPNEYTAVAPTPPGARYISVRGYLADTSGNTVSETIINAYRLR